ncbi:hypothetical protein LTR53_005465 [Teratosphaeriaceae sp. CCFEE 6253]|nr:hypothetical protein LTR53_005465 [Teratosphaeriaceae sp. CCFEE 6253]
MDDLTAYSPDAGEAPMPYEIEDGEGESVYTALDTGSLQIRLLYINEAACCSDSALCCDLYKVSLNDNPDYAALSYCWGDAVDTVDICLGGHTTPVTQNLANALCRLRELPKEFFWVDAVCINQPNLDERGKQVELMMEIYSGAALVYSYMSDDFVVPVDFIVRRRSIAEPVEIEVDPLQGSHDENPSSRHHLEQDGQTVDALDLAAEPSRIHAIGQAAKDVEAVKHYEEPRASPELQNIEEVPPKRIEPPPERLDSEVDLGLFWCNLLFAQLSASIAQSDETLVGSTQQKQPYRQKGMPVLANDAVTPVLRLMQNRYWTRVWIFQEMVLAESQTFLGRRTCINRAAFETVCSWLQKIADGDILRPAFVSLKTWSQWKGQIRTTSLHPLALESCRVLADQIDVSKPIKALSGPRSELLLFCEGRLAHDPRDHVYGMLGVLDPNLSANYHHSVRWVYCRWAKWLVSAGHSTDLGFLRRAGIGQNGNSDYRLPSWVPD